MCKYYIKILEANMNFRNLDGSIEFKDNQLTKKIVFNDEDVLGFVLNLKHGQTLPAHKHEDSSLTLVVLQGSGEVQVEGEIQKINKGSAVLVKGREELGIPKVDEDLSVFVTLTPKPKNTKFSKEIS
ncbi:MAG TPA: cupin [Clostridiales bacterium]|nr:cupin [Clostridiales bacterium]